MMYKKQKMGYGSAVKAGYGKSIMSKKAGGMVGDRNKNGVMEDWEIAIKKKIDASMKNKAKYGYAMEKGGPVIKAKALRRSRTHK